MKKYFLADEKGTIFLSTMISTLLMVMVCGSLYRLSTYDMHYISQLKKSLQAQQLAEAGLAEALSTLAYDWDSRSTAAAFPATSLSPGSYDVTITESSGRVLVSSEGTVDDTTRTATAEVTGPPPSAMDYSLAGDSVSFTLTGGSSVNATGGAYSNTTTNLNAQAGSSSITISGASNAGDSTTTSGSGTVSVGGINNNSALSDFPTVDFAYYQDIAQNGGGYYYNGNITYSSANSMPSPGGGVIFINGNVTITRSQNTTAAIFATGTITVSGGTLTANPSNDNYPALITQNGSIVVSGTGNSDPSCLAITGLVYSGNNFTITGNHHTVTVTNGSIIARGALTGDYQGSAQNDVSVTYSELTIDGFTSSSDQEFEILSYNR